MLRHGALFFCIALLRVGVSVGAGGLLHFSFLNGAYLRRNLSRILLINFICIGGQCSKILSNFCRISLSIEYCYIVTCLLCSFKLVFYIAVPKTSHALFTSVQPFKFNESLKIRRIKTPSQAVAEGSDKINKVL